MGEKTNALQPDVSALVHLLRAHPALELLQCVLHIDSIYSGKA